MIMAIAFDDAKANQYRRKGNGRNGTGETSFTRFFGSPDNPDLPDAHLAHRDPGRTSRAHFHRLDQFQVVVDGKGKLGRHDLAPYFVHFSRAYTPYGPLLALDTGTPLTAFVLRAHYDPGSQHLPEEKEQLKQ